MLRKHVVETTMLSSLSECGPLSFLSRKDLSDHLLLPSRRKRTPTSFDRRIARRFQVIALATIVLNGVMAVSVIEAVVPVSNGQPMS